MRFIQRYKSPNYWTGDSVRYEGKDYLVLINYIKEKQMQKTIHLRVIELF